MKSKKFLSGMVALLLVAGGVKVGAEAPNSNVPGKLSGGNAEQCAKFREKWVEAKYLLKDINKDLSKLNGSVNIDPYLLNTVNISMRNYIWYLRMIGKEMCQEDWVDRYGYVDSDDKKWNLDKLKFRRQRYCKTWKENRSPECRELNRIAGYNGL